MKKAFFPIVAGVIGISLPLIGMTISPTRSLILGLAPDEAILALADKIDEESGKNAEQEQKISDLQDTLSSQQKETEEKEVLAKLEQCKKNQDFCKQKLPTIGTEKVILEDNLGTIAGDRNKAITEAQGEIKRVRNEKESGEWSSDSVIEAMERSIKRQEKKIALIQELIKSETAEKNNLLSGQCKDYQNPCE